MRLSLLPLAAVAAFLTSPAYAQTADQPTEPTPPVTVTGSVGVVSDYRFRGVSQSDNNLAVQGGATLAHESGVYAGFWGSNLAGWGTFGGANVELDLIGGVKLPVAGGTLDTGLVWYMYPAGADDTDFGELFAKFSGTTGPLTLTAGAAYAPQQQALGNWYGTGAAAQTGIPDRPDDTSDNFYASGDGALAVPGTPVTAKAHIGYTKGKPGLGPNGTSVAPTGEYWDWSLGAEAALYGLTLGVAYIDTDISNREAAYLQPNFSRGQDGTGSIAGSTVVVSLTAAF